MSPSLGSIHPYKKIKYGRRNKGHVLTPKVLQRPPKASRMADKSSSSGAGGDEASSSSSASTQHKQRYIFGNRGVVRDIIYNKAILHFRLNNRDEKAILLAKNLTVDGRSPDEDGRSLQDVLRLGDEVGFACHLYDKGGAVGTGKDKCNYYAIQVRRRFVGGNTSKCQFNTLSLILPPQATKNSRDYDMKHGGGGAGGGGGAAGAGGAAGQRKDVLQVRKTVLRIHSEKVNRALFFLCQGTGWVSELNPRKGVLTFDHNGKDERVLFLASKVEKTKSDI